MVLETFMTILKKLPQLVACVVVVFTAAILIAIAAEGYHLGVWLKS